MTARSGGGALTLEKAIKQLQLQYDAAKKLAFVQDPLAYALHKVWKQADREADRKAERKREKMRATGSLPANTVAALEAIGRKTHRR